MEYSREHPSQRYQDLVSQYKALHVEGEKSLGLPPELTFPGKSLFPHVQRIKKIIDTFGVKSLLDYGSGKGLQYLSDSLTPAGEKISEDNYKSTDNITIQQFWGLNEIACYDPAYEPFSTLPDHKFGMVISTDVLEHCPEEDIDWILDEMFGFSKKCLFANVACFPAGKTLPNGENAHCTIKSPEWWHEKLIEISQRHPHVMFEFLVVFDKDDGGESKRVTGNITNIPA